MEDKTFELLTKLYSEFSEFRKDTNDFRKDITEKVENNSKEIKNLGNQVTRLENELKSDIDALYDGYKLVYEKLQEHDKRFDSIESKLEKQEVEIRVVKGGK